MSIGIAPLTHRCLLTREPCPICQRETLHKAFTCLSCGYTALRVVVKRKAFGARLVLNRRPKPS